MKGTLPGRTTTRQLATLGAMSILLVGGVRAATGQLLWENVHDVAGFSDEARAIAADQDRVYVAGSGQRPPSFFLVRAYAGKTGDLLWEDAFDTAGFSGTATAVATDHGRVFAVGDAGGDLCIRAYGGKTGALLWQDSFDLAGHFDTATAVVVDRGRVYVAGSGIVQESHPGFLGQALSIIRAYDTETGDLLWQDLFDLTMETQQTTATTITVHRGRVFAAGQRNSDFFVRALDADTGSLSWQDLSVTGRATGIAAERGLVYAVGEGLVVRAYDGQTGTLIWEDSVDAASGRAVSVGGGRVYVAGVIPNLGAGQGDDFLVRAYDAGSGALAWQDHFHGAGNRTNIALAVDFGGSGRRLRVYAAGFLTPSATNDTAYVVQAYDGQTGELVWGDVFDRSGGLDEAVAIVARKKRVYAAGFVSGNLNGEFFVRAYDAR